MHPSGISVSFAFALVFMGFFVIVTPFIVRKFFIVMWLIIVTANINRNFEKESES